MSAATVEHGEFGLGLAVAHDDKIDAFDQGVGRLVESESREARDGLWAHKGVFWGSEGYPGSTTAEKPDLQGIGVGRGWSLIEGL